MPSQSGSLKCTLGLFPPGQTWSDPTRCHLKDEVSHLCNSEPRLESSPRGQTWNSVPSSQQFYASPEPSSSCTQVTSTSNLKVLRSQGYPPGSRPHFTASLRASACPAHESYSWHVPMLFLSYLVASWRRANRYPLARSLLRGQMIGKIVRLSGLRRRGAQQLTRCSRLSPHQWTPSSKVCPMSFHLERHFCLICTCNFTWNNIFLHIFLVNDSIRLFTNSQTNETLLYDISHLLLLPAP